VTEIYQCLCSQLPQSICRAGDKYSCHAPLCFYG
jgi:hypothetical protein